MASKQGTVDYLLDQMGPAGAIAAKRMFGEYGLYCDGRFFALVCDDQLYLKPTAAGREWLGAVVEAPPYPGASNWLLVDGERWDDGAWLSRLAGLTAAALPPPAPKKPKAPKASGAAKEAKAPKAVKTAKPPKQ
ncbi:MAG: TfoX/Sxy family protein [Pseudomonadota bacterium]